MYSQMSILLSFQTVVDYLNEQNISYPDSTPPGNPCVVNDNLNDLCHILLTFGLEDDGVDDTKGSITPPKARKVEDGSDTR